MKCPYGCKIKKRSFREWFEEDAKLSSLSFYTISKSGKTLYEYFRCPKCHRVFKRGHRIHTMKKPEINVDIIHYTNDEYKDSKGTFGEGRDELAEHTIVLEE